MHKSGASNWLLDSLCKSYLDGIPSEPNPLSTWGLQVNPVSFAKGNYHWDFSFFARLFV